MSNILQLLEKRIQSIVERMPEIFQKDDPKRAVVSAITKQFQENVKIAQEQKSLLSNRYQILLNPKDFQFFQREEGWIHEITNVLSDSAQELGLQFAGPLDFQFVSTEDFDPGEFEILLDNQEIILDQTTAFNTTPQRETNRIPDNAFLILPERQVFPLDRGIIQIGRKDDNHLVINQKSVSRNHVQLRAIAGKYTIFDLDSSGGTYVNGVRVTQAVLLPGDVIKLADYPMIYGEENASMNGDQDQTTELPKFVDKS